MKTRLAISSLLIATAISLLALTPQEREFVETARGYVQQAQEKAKQEQKIQEEQILRVNQLDQAVDEQRQELEVLSKQVDDKQKESVELAKYNAYAKPIIDRVNSYWGLGAFAYGAQILAKHILILLGVLVGVGIFIAVLSFVLPPFGAALRVAWSVILKLFKK